MAINRISDLDYGQSLQRFQTTVKYMVKNWEKNGYNADPFDNVHVKEMFFRACVAGNMTLVKWLWDNYSKDLDPNMQRNSIPGSKKSILAETIYGGRGPNDPKGRTGSFREVAIFLMDMGADPAINDNEPLLACKQSSIDMFDGENMWGRTQAKVGHDKVVLRLLSEPRVAEIVFDKQQIDFYKYFKAVEDIFIF